LVHGESSFSASQTTPAAAKAGSAARESVRRRSGFVQVGLREAIAHGSPAGWKLNPRALQTGRLHNDHQTGTAVNAGCARNGLSRVVIGLISNLLQEFKDFFTRRSCKLPLFHLVY
jgi:hypothetical protein